MSRAPRDERGQVIVLAAVMIPVLLLLVALVVDVGNWYTHKRQLQNRADAAAFAAGVAYAKNWRACVQTNDPALKASTAQKIADAARQYAGDPDPTDYAGDVLPGGPLENTQIANQSKVDVAINSTSYDDNTDYSDDYDGVATNTGDPCFSHPKNVDSISPGGGQWTDVKVKERDLPSLFGGIGLPLSRNGARARIEIRPALSGHRFLPLAVPNVIITKVQIRYFDECRDPSHQNPLAIKDLAPLPSADQAGYAATGGGTLWGLPSVADPKVGDKNLSFGLTVPSYGGCGQDYLPIGVQVRVASRDQVDLNQSCAALTAASYADCFTRISQFRVFNDGNPDSQPRITNVRLTGGCGAPGDAYFAPLPDGAANCAFGLTAEVNWGSRDDGNLNVPANFTVTANGEAMTLISTTSGQSGTYSTSGSPITFTPGANDATVSLDWIDKNTTHSWAGNQCKNNNNSPCKYSGTQAVQRTWLGADNDDMYPAAAFTGPVELVRTSQSSFVSGVPGPPLENVNNGGAAGIPPSPIQVFPSVGTRSQLRTGDLTILRASSSQGTGLLKCDFYPNGQAFDGFVNGCNPWYAANTFTNGPWWNTTTNQCPDPGQWFGPGTFPAPYGKNSETNPWRCVLTVPGKKTGQVGDWMSAGTKNCNDIKNNKCGDIHCNWDGNYDGKTGKPDGWLQQGGDSQYPRVVSLFVVPYQALKNAQGSGDPIPVLGFASFYVMSWEGSGGDGDPCPDNTFDSDHNPATPQVTLPAMPKQAVRGVFVETVKYEPGPVDPNATCVEDQLTPCRVTLVR